MNLPELPISATEMDAKLVENSPSGFWPIEAKTCARIISHSISLPDPGAEKSLLGNFASANTPHAPAELNTHLQSMDDPVGFANALFQKGPIACTIISREGHVRAMNLAAERLFGTRSHADYNIYTDHLALEHGLVNAVRRSLAGETVALPTFWYDPRELRNIKITEAKRVAIATTIFPIVTSANTIDYVALIFRDDTEIALAQQRLRLQAEQLEQHVANRTAELQEANKQLEAFSYSVSHDLRTPLRALDAFTTLLAQDEKSKLSENARDYLRRIRIATGRMTNLIRDLLVFSQAEKQALTLLPIAPTHLVNLALQELEPKLRDRTVHIRVGHLPQVRGDAGLLREVFLNLLDNAIKFSSRTEIGRIEIDTRVEGDRIVWYVSDNGVGFDMKYYEKLFGVFSRLHSKEDFDGTGVGLALVQRIIRRHGGEIWARAEPGKGATFYFTLGQ
jgi:signal transduction histidine kinase